MSVFLNGWEKAFMTMFSAIFDGSGSPGETIAVVVAGYVAPVDQWLRFETDWQKCLDDFGVTSLHMRHFAHSRGEFETWKGDEKKRRAFLSRLISIIRTRVQHTFACAVPMSDYRELDAEYCLSEFSKPYAVAGCTCISKLFHWADKWMSPEDRIQIVFEDGDEDKGDLMRTAKKHFHITPIFLPKSRSVVFQAADLVAYEHLLANVRIAKAGPRELGLEELRHPLKELSKIPGALSADWGVCRKEDIMETIRNAKVAKR